MSTPRWPQGLLSLLAGLLLVPAAAAGGLDGLELDVIGADETPETMMRRIELPASATDRGSETSIFGRESAGDARERGADVGQQTAEQARERPRPPREGAGGPIIGAEPPSRPTEIPRPEPPAETQ